MARVGETNHPSFRPTILLAGRPIPGASWIAELKAANRVSVIKSSLFLIKNGLFDSGHGPSLLAELKTTVSSRFLAHSNNDVVTLAKDALATINSQLAEMDTISRAKLIPAGTAGSTPPPLPPTFDFTSSRGQYKKLSKIGQGGMGAVHLCQNTDGKKFAVKSMLLNELLGQEGTPAEIRTKVVHQLLRFRREYEIGVKLDHPNFARATDTNLYDVFPELKDGTVAKSKIIDIFDNGDASWQQLFVNPNQEYITFKPNIKNEIETRVSDANKKIKLLTILQLTQDAAEAFENSFDINRVKDLPEIFIVMDFVAEHEGRDKPAPTLETVASTGMAERPALKLFLPLLDAVTYYHRQSEHRDLKPKNILLTEDQRGIKKPVIIDNGISKSLSSDTKITNADQLVGTRDYMAPSAYKVGTKENFGKADIFGLGVIMLECLTGRNQLREIVAGGDKTWFPFMRGETTLDTSGVANFDLRKIIDKMLSNRPEDNFGSVAEVSAALRVLAQLSTNDGGTAAGSASTEVAPTLPQPIDPLTSFRSELEGYFRGVLPPDPLAAKKDILARLGNITDPEVVASALDAVQMLSELIK